jgi:hypothetical protein
MVRRLRLLNDLQDGPWRELAIQINIEVRRPMLFSMTNKGFTVFIKIIN